MKGLPLVMVKVLATVVIAFGIARIFGTIPFAPWATDALIRFAAWFGAYGVEQVEDVYAVTSFVVALVLSVALVWSTNRLLRRRRA